MRNVSVWSGFVLLGVVAMGAVGAAQEGKIAQSSDEIRQYERLVQQPAAENSGAAWWKLAMLYQDAARYDDSERAYSRALDYLKSGDHRTLANVMDCMGTLYVERGRTAEGEKLELKALGLREEQSDQLGVGLSWMHLAMLSLGKKDSASGEMYAELAVERLNPDHKESGATQEQKMTALTYLALARCAAHSCADALSPLKKAMKIAEQSYRVGSFPVAYISFLEGYADWKLGKNGEAAKLMQSGTEGMEAQLGWGHPTFVSAMRQYEEFLVATRRNAEAAEVRAKLDRLSSSSAQRAERSARAEGASPIQR
jgi:tetratricopeptide (TPR) repeat protein